jgi:transposase-like protein
MKTSPNNETANGSRRHRKRTAAQRSQYLRQWEASGLTAEAFARLHPINAQSLYRWRMKEKSGKLVRPDSGRSHFRELKIAEFPARPGEQLPSVTMKSPALQITLSGVELDLRLCAFLKSLSKEVFGV